MTTKNIPDTAVLQTVGAVYDRAYLVDSRNNARSYTAPTECPIAERRIPASDRIQRPARSIALAKCLAYLRLKRGVDTAAKLQKPRTWIPSLKMLSSHSGR